MESDSPRSAVRRHVRAERERRDWTQSDLATAAGVSRGTVANLERGIRLTEGKESKIETALGKPVGWLDGLRAGHTEIDDSDDALDATPARVDPDTGTLGDLQREMAYFRYKFRDTPEDFSRLMDLVDLFHRVMPPASSTHGGLDASTGS